MFAGPLGPSKRAVPDPNHSRPGNVLIVRSDGDLPTDFIYVADFGIARALDGSTSGSLPPPEPRSARSDGRPDVEVTGAA